MPIDRVVRLSSVAGVSGRGRPQAGGQESGVDMASPGRGRGGLSAARSGDGFSDRVFYCRRCSMVARGLHVPAGWYLLERSVGHRGKHLRLGMYCSLRCLLAAGEDLRVGESDHAQRLGLAADPDRDRRRLIERAKTLLHSGHTIRQAAEVLELPTGALRTWLRAAGVRVGAEGTMDGPTNAPTTATAGSGVAAVRSPVATLHEMAQAGRLRDLQFEGSSSGPDHARTFAATASVRIVTEEGAIDEPVVGRGSGRSKSAAKTAAAADLLATLQWP